MAKQSALIVETTTMIRIRITGVTRRSLLTMAPLTMGPNPHASAPCRPGKEEEQGRFVTAEEERPPNALIVGYNPLTPCRPGKEEKKTKGTQRKYAHGVQPHSHIYVGSLLGALMLDNDGTYKPPQLFVPRGLKSKVKLESV